MTYALRKDTLAGIKQSALFLKKNMAVQPVTLAAAQLVAYETAGAGLVHPEQEAFKFYYANHVFSMITSKYGPHEPLPLEVAELARAYVKLSSDLAVRLAYYCLLIIVREARHMHSNPTAIAIIKDKWGASVANFLKSIRNSSEDAAVNKLRNSPPNTTLGQLVSGITDAFNYPGIWTGGYGGKAWGKVSETLRSMIYGETTPEMFADTAYTLAHNGGPIFNKGMLYNHQDNGKLFKTLDVQRAGMVPQLWNDVPTMRPSGPQFTEFVTRSKALFSEATSGYVDWFKVMALGALHGPYSKEKAEQIAKHGASPLATALDKAEAVKFYITNTEFVTIYQREKEKEAA
jgi:hypothetical protein